MIAGPGADIFRSNAEFGSGFYMAGSEKKIRLTLPVLPAPGPLAAGAEGAGSLASLGGARIGVVTLGCDKNTVDSERILGRLAGAGLAAGSGAADADVVVINTCGFIEPAKEESIEAILEAVRLKEEGRIRAVVAMGCLVERYKSELEAELPEVDLFLGLGEVDRLLPELEAMGLGAPGDPIPTMERPLRVLSTSTNHTSFLKISEGCDHGCAFCAIPLMRGRHRSSPIEELVREAAELEAAGVVELNIISQDTTWYGRDWRGGGGGLAAGRAPRPPAHSPRRDRYPLVPALLHVSLGYHARAGRVDRAGAAAPAVPRHAYPARVGYGAAADAAPGAAGHHPGAGGLAAGCDPGSRAADHGDLGVPW